eukprot:TRINITY_DN27584_c0_g1_i1.p1 TRINITY_DN27584_c0_g1~~TRINITY_DN27584_c0_g1_i1.p1  ORF type:complete len:267 (+),score=38.06 TRINITY_DN27584_c0_g1_i1:38-838(+)
MDPNDETPTGCDLLFMGGYGRRKRRITIGEVELEIKQGRSNGELSGLVWPSSIVAGEVILIRYKDGKGKKALELGAGCGIGSLIAASKGWTVTATDTEIGLSDLHRNMTSANMSAAEASGGSVTVAPLDWSTFDPSNFNMTHFDLIIVSDCLNIPSLHDSLVSILSNVSTDASVLITSQLRRLQSERSFFLKLLEAGFCLNELELPQSVPFNDQQRAFLYVVEAVKGNHDGGLIPPLASILKQEPKVEEKSTEGGDEEDYPDGLYL